MKEEPLPWSPLVFGALAGYLPLFFAWPENEEQAQALFILSVLLSALFTWLLYRVRG